VTRVYCDKMAAARITRILLNSSLNSLNFSMVSLTAKFEEGPLDLGAQTKAVWFSDQLRGANFKMG